MKHRETTATLCPANTALAAFQLPMLRNVQVWYVRSYTAGFWCGHEDWYWLIACDCPCFDQPWRRVVRAEDLNEAMAMLRTEFSPVTVDLDAPATISGLL